jgi:hypothetical protein
MAATGIIQRRGTKASLISSPPVVGELVFATDTGEHGWLNETSTLVWKKLDAASTAQTHTFCTIDSNSNFDIGIEVWGHKLMEWEVIGAPVEVTLTYKTHKINFNGFLITYDGILTIPQQAFTNPFFANNIPKLTPVRLQTLMDQYGITRPSYESNFIYFSFFEGVATVYEGTSYPFTNEILTTIWTKFETNTGIVDWVDYQNGG